MKRVKKCSKPFTIQLNHKEYLPLGRVGPRCSRAVFFIRPRRIVSGEQGVRSQVANAGGGGGVVVAAGSAVVAIAITITIGSRGYGGGSCSCSGGGGIVIVTVGSGAGATTSTASGDVVRAEWFPMGCAGPSIVVRRRWVLVRTTIAIVRGIALLRWVGGQRPVCMRWLLSVEGGYGSLETVYIRYCG